MDLDMEMELSLQDAAEALGVEKTNTVEYYARKPRKDEKRPQLKVRHPGGAKRFGTVVILGDLVTFADAMRARDGGIFHRRVLRWATTRQQAACQ